MMDSFLSHSYCRLCAELTVNCNIINVGSEGAITKKLDRINASIDFNDDVLPKTLCRECAGSLENAYDFVLKIEEAQSKLHTIFHSQSFKRETKEEKVFLDIAIDDTVKKEEVKQESDNKAAVPEPMTIEIDSDSDDSRDVKQELIDVDDNDINNHSDDHPMSDTDDNVNQQTEVTGTAKNKKKIPKPKKTVTSKRAAKKDTSNASPTEQCWKDYTWKCAICEIEFNSFDKLKIHATQLHNICNAFRCVDCNKRKLRLDKFLDHVKLHRNYLKAICFKCDERFASAVHLNIHKASHQSGSQTVHTCPGCHTEFNNLADFNKHTSEFYQESQWKPVTWNGVQITDNLTCLLCNKTFNNKGLLDTHTQIHTKEEEKPIKIHTKEKKKRAKLYTCERCGKSFIAKAVLEQHIRRHDNIRPFECQICNKWYISQSELKSHIRMHDNTKPFSCEQCGSCFRVRKQLNIHKKIHMDLPYACSSCDQRFKLLSHLNLHKLQHSGIKPHSCRICPRDFTNWSNYNNHMKRKHKLDMAKRKWAVDRDGLCPTNSVTEEVVTVPQSGSAGMEESDYEEKGAWDPAVTDTTNSEN